MTLIDYIVLFVLGVSVLFGVIRGLMKEVLSLAAWVISFIAANALAPQIARVLPQTLATEEIRLLVSFVGIFILVLVAMSVLAVMMSRLAKIAGLGSLDRVLGGVFGLARGVVVVMILALLAGLTSLPRQPMWRNAFMSHALETLAGHIAPWLPADFRQRISYR